MGPIWSGSGSARTPSTIDCSGMHDRLTLRLQRTRPAAARFRDVRGERGGPGRRSMVIDACQTASGKQQMSDRICELARGTTAHAWYSLLDDTPTFDRQIRQISPIGLLSVRFTYLPFLTTSCAERISSWLAGSAREFMSPRTAAERDFPGSSVRSAFPDVSRQPSRTSAQQRRE